MNTLPATPLPAARLRLRRSVALVSGILLASLLLSACAAMFSPGPPPSRLQLSPAMPGKMAGTPLNKQLVVATPLAGSEIDSDSIALVFNGREVRYLADARWTSPVPSLLRRNLIEALEATGALRGISDEMAGIAANARLLTDVRQFSLHYSADNSPPVAVFDATFRLLNLSDGKIAGTKTVEVKTPASGTDKAALVRACETALEKALAETASWVVEEMRRMK